MQNAPIIVVGSANQDYIVRVAEAPKVGQTLLAKSLLRQPGGKGANQAVAAARLRGNVSFVGCVGDDEDGATVIRVLRAEGVDTSNLEIIGRGRTGLAIVTVFDSGDNTILVVPGSNFALTPRRVAAVIQRLAAARAVLLLQAELEPEIIGTAIASGEAAGLRVVLNLAPYIPLSTQLLAHADPLVVNETEASSLLGWPISDLESARAAAIRLRTVSRSVVITLGSAGAFWADQGDAGHVAAPVATQVIDTTGAGDAFVGAMAVILAEGGALKDAVEVGVRAGTFAVGSPGAQSSYATRADLDLETGVDEQGPFQAAATR